MSLDQTLSEILRALGRIEGRVRKLEGRWLWVTGGIAALGLVCNVATYLYGTENGRQLRATLPAIVRPVAPNGGNLP